MISQDNTDRKTPTDDVPELIINSGSKKEKTKEKQLRNVLNKYRSYTYNFTLAALHKSQLSTPEAYRGKPLDFVVLKSGGKGKTGLSTSFLKGPTDAQVEANKLTQQKVRQALQNVGN